MKKIIQLSIFFIIVLYKSQFNVSIAVSENFNVKEAVLYTLDGSKDIIQSKKEKSGNSWKFKVDKNYLGMLKIYFPEINYSLLAISEGKDVNIQLITNGTKISDIKYLDASNQLMERVQDLQKKNEAIFPALVQIRNYYKNDSDFGKALDKEIDRLGEKVNILPTQNPFVSYYNINYNRFLVDNSVDNKPTQEEIIQFLNKSNEMLESSSLFRPILVEYLNLSSSNVEQSINKLLEVLDVETPRGQTALSEMIELFDVYGMVDLKAKYLSEANSLKCTINDRLSSTINVNKNIEIGAIFPDYKFTSNVSGTSEKKLHQLKADKKVIIFWSSTCSHCEREIPVIFEKYAEMQKQNVQVIGLSLDTDFEAYKQKVENLPWVNDTELQGWYSSFAGTYNIHATPTYFVLDANNKIIAKPNHASDVLQFLKLK